MTSGPPALPGRESAREPQHGGKARDAVKASKAWPRKARVTGRRPDCLKPSPQMGTSPDTTPEVGATGIGRFRFFVSTLPAGGRQATSLFKGTDRAAYITLDTSGAERNSGWPTGREPYGHGVSVVVVGATPHLGERESRLQGEAAPSHSALDRSRRERRFGRRRPLGHPPDLDAKARGDSSMAGKRGTQRRR